MFKSIQIAILLASAATLAACGGSGAEPAGSSVCRQTTMEVASRWSMCRLVAGQTVDNVEYRALQLGYWQQAGCNTAADYAGQQVDQWCIDWASRLDCSLLTGDQLPPLPLECAAPFAWAK